MLVFQQVGSICSQKFKTMKTMKSHFSSARVKALVCLFVFLSSRCSDPDQLISPLPVNPDSAAGNWVNLMDELFYDPGTIVQKGNSIQEALDAAGPGEVIYVEPGVYREEVIIDKPGIKLVGLHRGDGEMVVIDEPGTLQKTIAQTGRGVDARILNIMYPHTAGDDTRGDARRSGKKKGEFQPTKTEISPGVFHYQFSLRLGEHAFDVVRIHRVVREGRSSRPLRAKGAVFMLHGASLTFESIFLKAGATDATAETSPAVYLAENNIDVWGMDFAWTLVPPETTDFSFMADWGIERDAAHALAAVSVARLIRGLSGQGFGKLNVLGYSYGGAVAYAAAGRETQQHPILRDVRGIVAVDQVLKYAETEEDNRLLACTAATNTLQMINDGVYHSNGGQVFSLFAARANAAPDGPSEFIPGLTNYQASLFVGTSTFALPNATTPIWHFVGGDFSDGNFPFPKGLLYADPSRWIGLLASLPPYQPTLTVYEARACLCDEADVRIDDHIGEISLPILYLGAGGAFGELGNHTASLTSSQDITNHTISLQPENAVADFGHADLFLGTDAPDLVWSVLRQWLVNHSRAMM